MLAVDLKMCKAYIIKKKIFKGIFEQKSSKGRSQEMSMA